MSQRITFTNNDLGIQSRVIPNGDTFTVVLHDLDADATLPMAKRLTTQAGAESYAKSLVGRSAVRAEVPNV